MKDSKIWEKDDVGIYLSDLMKDCPICKKRLIKMNYWTCLKTTGHKNLITDKFVMETTHCKCDPMMLIPIEDIELEK